MRFGTIHLNIVGRIHYLFIIDPLRGMVITRNWGVILVFSWLVFYCIILVCCVCLLVCTLFYFIFIVIFVTEVFERPFEGDSPQCYRFIIVIALETHSVRSVLKRLADYVKTSFSRSFGVEYTYSAYRDLAGDYFSTDVFRKL